MTQRTPTPPTAPVAVRPTSSRGPQTKPHPAGDPSAPRLKRQNVTFSFFRFTDAFHALALDQRSGVAAQLVDLVKRWETRSDQKQDMILKTYSLAGVRAEADLMFWFISEDLDHHEQFSAELYSADLGRYLHCVDRYLSQTKRSQYVVKLDPEKSEEESRFRIVPGNRKYNFVYPFVKTRDWYLLSKQARQGIMDEHIEVGSSYPSVKLNTTYSFGLDDQEFVVAFETDEPGDFLDLVQALRETESSKYTLRDTPIYTCIRRSIEEIVAQFGAGA